jgi:hypothetical protein
MAATAATSECGAAGKRKREEEDATAHPELLNEYAGFVTTSAADAAAAVEVVDAGEVTPEGLFKDYIAARKPCLIRGRLTGGGECWNLMDKWTGSYLRDKAGGCRVRVEHRKSSGDRFGQGNERSMSFAEFLDAVDAGDDSLYLSAQNLPVDETGRPNIVTPPLSELRSDFPLRPSLLGNLVPSNVNLWMGLSKEGAGSNSGLHVDFHENLYVLLRGRKQFKLFCPRDAAQMYTVGKVVRVHPNGRINFEGLPTEADGRDLAAERALDAARRLDEAAARADAADQEDGNDSDDQAIEDALEAVLEAECGNLEEEDDDEDEEEDDDVIESALADGTSSEPITPPNFSRVDLSLPRERLDQEFPGFSDLVSISVEVKAGESIYIPAGWYHSVTSMGAGADEKTGGQQQAVGSAQPSVHMAFNIW